MATNKHEIDQINRSIVADVKLLYNPKVKASERPVIQRSEDVYKVFMEKWDMNSIYLVEEFKLMLLNRGNRVLGVVPISSGGMTGTVADPRVVFRFALLSGATAIAICHNHPSANKQPSKADENLTQKFKQIAQFHDILENPLKLIP